MSVPPPNLSVIVATYNRPRSLLHLLEQLNDQRCIDLRDVDVCVVDDGSTDIASQFSMKESEREISYSTPTWYRFNMTYIYRNRAKDNTSRVYSSRNLAASETTGRFILQLDDDLEFHPYLLNFLQSMADMSYGHWVWCPRISNNSDVDADGYAKFERGKDGRWFDGACRFQETHWQSTTSAGMFMPRYTWEAVGGYNEIFDGCMGIADRELALRVQKLGRNPGDVKVFLAPYFVNIADEETGSWRMTMIDRALNLGRERNETIFDKIHPDAERWCNV